MKYDLWNNGRIGSELLVVLKYEGQQIKEFFLFGFLFFRVYLFIGFITIYKWLRFTPF
jgi:hypothetical protein